MSSESRGCIFTDSMRISLSSLADAADALAQAAATLAAAARATTEAFSAQTPVSPEIREGPGINLGKGHGDVHLPVSGNKGEVDHKLDLDAGGDGGDYTAGSENSIEPLTGSNAQKPEGPGGPDCSARPYRLLVDTEADVLVYVCTLIDKRQRAICYMPCGTNPLKTYKLLIESVTETPVYILTSSTASMQDQAYVDFLKNDGAVLLIPESLSPKFEIEGPNSWVIHVGWPVSEGQYTTQRRNHQAQNNLLVAYAEDQSLYSSGDSIVELTEPWPQDGPSLRGSVSILRPLYEVMLSEIPLEMKARIYQDWLQFHAARGPRHVKKWTTSTMVQRANDYILKALHWSGPHTGDIPLPEVSDGFVSQNELESAVQEGILRVEDDDSDHPEPSRNPTPRPDSMTTQTEFQTTTGHTYFSVEEEFDAIPLMGFIGSKYDRVICFLDGQGALRYYQRLLSKIMGRSVFFPANGQAIEQAAVQFMSAPLPAALLLTCNTANIPSVLNQSAIDCCIYWGFNAPLKHAKKNRTLINCSTTIIIMTAIQRRGLPGSSDIRKHPSAEISLDLTEGSVLSPMRNKTKLALTSDKTTIRELYTNRVYGIAAVPRTSLSAENAAHRANQYAARVLLHGELADGSEIFPPVAGRPSLPRVAVEKFNLQPAVDAGLLTVIG